MIEVVEYDSRWPEIFERIRARIWPVVRDVAISVEHVGSTSVPGLAAKPVIDLDVVVAEEHVAPAIARLATLGYVHQGDLGVPGREAFRRGPHDAEHRHNLYVCVDDCLALRNHLAVRAYLREHPEAAHEYGVLKRQLAARHADDVDAYVAGKTPLLSKVLLAAGLSRDDVAAIAGVNAGTSSILPRV